MRGTAIGDGDVEASGVDIVSLGEGRKSYPRRRIGLQESRQARLQPLSRKTRTRRDNEMILLRLWGYTLRRLSDDLEGVLDLLGVCPASDGKMGATGAALEQGNTEKFFELLHMVADG